jgi:serine/threonine protein kinase/Tol biopolymer transport system component
MGEVYRARDLRLGREVAVKVLPAEYSNDPELLRRFEQEARATAALNHPNILALFDIARQDESPYIVSELLEGETLRGRLSGGALPVKIVIDYSLQILCGLAEAHDRGIFHRDIKPENIFVTHGGQIKILDFGLAKLTMPEWKSIDGLTAELTTEAATGHGTILGTMGYMSPEQLRGQPIDARSDLFSFGVVLYEMLSGRRPFHGETTADTISAVLREDPPELVATGRDVPPVLERIVRHCLEKDPAARFQSARDVEFALESLSIVSSSSPSPATEARSRKTWLIAAALVLVVAGFATWAAFTRSRQAVQNPLSNAQFTPLTNLQGSERDPAISPDGKFVAFISDRGGTFDIWLIQANGGSLANLTRGRMGDARAPLRAIGFTSDGSEVWSAGTPERRLMLWPLMGGAPHNFLNEQAAEVAWSPDGARLVYHTAEPGDPVFVADHNGANPRQIVQNEPGLHNHYPIWSEDGRWIYLVRGRPATREMDLWRISPDGADLEQLTHLNADVAYPVPIDNRTLLFVAHNEDGAGPWLWAFDMETRTSRRVSSGLEQYASLTATSDGRRLAANVVNPKVSLWTVPIADRVIEEKDVEAFPLPTVRAHAPRFGGGSLFYLSSRDGADGLWSYRDGQALEIWNGSEGALQSPSAVSVDGKSVAFALKRNGKQQMHVMRADGTRLQPLSAEVDARGAASWSPDGQWVVTAGSDGNGAGLFKLPVNGGPPVRIAKGPFLDPVWSPRGDLIVYCGTQVFTRTPLLAVHPDGTPEKLPEINVQREGERARFLPDGSGLVYMLGSTLAGQDFWLLDLGTMQSRRLTRLSDPAVMQTFDVTSDGSRIVFDRLRENSDILLINLGTK